MQRPIFTVSIRDLERADQRRTWEIPSEWIDWALTDSEARSDGTAGSLELYVKKNGREVLVKGQATASVTMPCARTLEPVAVNLEAEILLLLTPRATSAPAATKTGRKPRTPRTDRWRSTTPEEAAAADPNAELLSTEQAARDEYEGETVELDSFIREHLLLELPLFPVRSDLPFEPNAGTDTPPDDSGDHALDPRLAPLAALASQLRSSKE